MSVRKAHNSGRNHLRNVVDYYQQIGHEKAQSVIDSITNSYAAEGQASSNPMLQQPSLGVQPGFAPPPFGFPPPGGRGMPPPPFPPPVGRGMPPFPPPGNMPFPPPNMPFPPPNMPFPPPGAAGVGSPPEGLPFPPPPGGFPNMPFPPPGGLPALPGGLNASGPPGPPGPPPGMGGPPGVGGLPPPPGTFQQDHKMD